MTIQSGKYDTAQRKAVSNVNTSLAVTKNILILPSVVCDTDGISKLKSGVSMSSLASSEI